MSDEIGEQNSYLMQQAMSRIRRFMQKDLWGKVELNEILSSMMPTNEAYHYMLDMVDHQLATGASLADLKFRNRFMDEFYGYLNWMYDRNADQLSRIASMIPTSSDRFLIHRHQSPEFFLEPFIDVRSGKPVPVAGRFGTISGPIGVALGVGKTDKMMATLDMAMDMGFAGATNTMVKNRPKHLELVTTLEDLVIVAVNNLLGRDRKGRSTGEDGRMTFAGLDGLPQFMTKTRATSTENVTLENLSYFFRKIGIDFIGASQRDEAISTPIMNMQAWHIQKLGQTQMLYWYQQIENRPKHQNYKDAIRERPMIEHFIVEVPRTKLEFETYDFEYFDVDFDLRGMLKMMAGMDEEERTREGQLEAILDFLSLENKPPTKAEVKTALRVLSWGGEYNQTELGKMLKLSQSTVSNYQREMGFT
jgi:hypothetical protein